MAMMGMQDFVKQRVDAGSTHSEISQEICQMFPGQRGYSARSVRRFCADNGITRRTGMEDSDIVQHVERAVAEVSATPEL